MTTQQDQKIEELSHKNRVLVDKVSVLERENRKLKERYAIAATRVLELETEAEELEEQITVANKHIDVLRPLADMEIQRGLLSPFGANDGKGFEIPVRTNASVDSTYQTAQQGLPAHWEYATPEKKADNG